MIKQYKNAVFKKIEASGFSAGKFKCFEKIVDEHPAFIVRLENSPMFFMLRTSNDDYQKVDSRYIEFSPNYSKSDYIPNQDWGNLDGAIQQLHNWLHGDVAMYLEEVEAPDLWEQLSSDQLFDIQPTESLKSHSFDKVEKEKIRAALQQFSEKITIKFKPNDDQFFEIKEKLDYLGQSLDRLDKFDWQGIAYSTLISISIALSLDNEDGKLLMQLFKESFTYIAGLIS